MFRNDGETEGESMIARYLACAIKQARERARILKGKIPNPAPIAELTGLQRTCEQRLDAIIAALDQLIDDPLFGSESAARQRIRLFRRAHEELAHIEATGIAALNRHNADDVFMNRLVFQIHKEIGYPLAPPAVTCLSQQYFLIYPALGLLAVPLAESDFLLNLPDLYHELAHPLLSTRDNPKLDGLQMEFARLQEIISLHFQQEKATNIRSTGPKEYFSYVLDALERAWLKFWAAELFCDLFATYTLGPAYACTHFHLTATGRGDPFMVRLERLMPHPPDQARMDVMLLGLGLLNWQAEASGIAQRWNHLVNTLSVKRHNLYERACPGVLLEAAAVCAFEGAKKLGCTLASEDSACSGEIRRLLNTAWREFWTSPEQYPAWERTRVAELRQLMVG